VVILPRVFRLSGEPVPGMDAMADKTDDNTLPEDPEAVDEVKDDELDPEDDSDDALEDDSDDAEALEGEDADDDDADAKAPADAKAAEEDDDDEDEDDVEADLDTILKERLATADEQDDDEEETVVAVKKAAGEDAAGKRSNEIVCTNCFLLVKESQLGPTGERTCPSGEDEADCAAIIHFGS